MESEVRFWGRVRGQVLSFEMMLGFFHLGKARWPGMLEIVHRGSNVRYARTGDKTGSARLKNG